MANLSWGENSNIEDSLKEYLESEITSESLTVFYNGDSLPIYVRIGYPESNDWTLPVISLYELGTANPRPFVGTTKIIPEISLIIEVRALNDRMRSDLARWVRDKINGGFPSYKYSPNGADPDSPNKTLLGNASVDFLTDAPIRLANVDEIDLFKHRFTVSVINN